MEAGNRHKNLGYLIVFFLIIYFAFILRVYNLSGNPPGFYVDEAAIGFNAYTIGVAGIDEHLVKYPIFFQSFGDYRLPLPIYATVPSVMLFGLSEFSVRFVAAIFGVLSIIFMMLAVGTLYDKLTAILVGLFLAISPWHLHMSRMAIEYVFWLGTFPIGFYFLAKSLRNPMYLLPMAFFFGISLYTYYASLFVTPLFLIMAFILFWRQGIVQKNVQIVIISICIYVLFCLPLFYGYQSGVLLTRWKTVNRQHTLAVRVQNFAKSYVQHFTMDFLFTKGDSGMPGQRILRHSVSGVGEMYLFDLPLLLLGLYIALAKRGSIPDWLMFWLILLFPIGSALLDDGPFAIRSVIGVLPLVYFSAVGLRSLLAFIARVSSLAYRLTFYVIVGFIVFLSFFDFGYKLFHDYPLYADGTWGWSYGVGEMINYFTSINSAYDDLYWLKDRRFNPIMFKFYDSYGRCTHCKIGSTLQLNHKRRQVFAGRVEQLVVSCGMTFYPQKAIFYHNGTIAYLIGAYGPANTGLPACRGNSQL